MAAASKKSAPAQTVSAEVPMRMRLPRSPGARRPQFAGRVSNAQRDFRGALEKGIAESRTAFAKLKSAADETATAFEASLAAAKDGAVAINAKAFEVLRANADANFDFMKAALATRSLPDFFALQSDFARKQIEAMSGQSKDFGALTQKAMAQTVEPIKGQVAKSFKIAV